jgi:hypothetical protein
MNPEQSSILDLGEVSFHAEPTLELAGQTFRADATKAYVSCKLAFGFPVVSTHGTTAHPAIVAKSYQSMLHQVLNVGHRMKMYDPKKIGRDFILGAVVAVDFPPAPFGGWQIGELSETPGMSCVAVIHKSAEKAQPVIGEHLTGRRKWSVSLEMLWLPEHSGVAVHESDLATVARPKGNDATPADFARMGYHYFSHEEDPELFNDVYKVARRGVSAKYKSAKVAVLCGGLEQGVHYSGIAMTPFGAEPTAGVQHMVASDPEAEVAAIEAADFIRHVNQLVKG